MFVSSAFGGPRAYGYSFPVQCEPNFGASANPSSQFLTHTSSTFFDQAASSSNASNGLVHYNGALFPVSGRNNASDAAASSVPTSFGSSLGPSLGTKLASQSVLQGNSLPNNNVNSVFYSTTSNGSIAPHMPTQYSALATAIKLMSPSNAAVNTSMYPHMQQSLQPALPYAPYLPRFQTSLDPSVTVKFSHVDGPLEAYLHPMMMPTNSSTLCAPDAAILLSPESAKPSLATSVVPGLSPLHISSPPTTSQKREQPVTNCRQSSSESCTSLTTVATSATKVFHVHVYCFVSVVLIFSHLLLCSYRLG